MLLRDIYETIVAQGIENDPRGKDTVMKTLHKREKIYKDMKDAEKEFFDTENLTNPYYDTRILNGTGNENIKIALVGIDMEMAELLLADRLSSKGKKIDLVMAHHPEGRAFANFYEVMHMQADILNKFGVPINVAESLLEGRIKEVERRLSPANHSRAVDVAKLLEIPFLCVHTPADNMVACHLQHTFDEKKPETLEDILELLRAMPEYREAGKNNTGPKIFLGSKDRKAGKIFVDMTGGTEGAKDIFESLVNSGINTIVVMHLSEDHRKEAEKYHINAVNAGHIASDNLGMNLMLDEIEKKDPIEVLACSGFRRFKRD